MPLREIHCLWLQPGSHHKRATNYNLAKCEWPEIRVEVFIVIGSNSTDNHRCYLLWVCLSFYLMEATTLFYYGELVTLLSHWCIFGSINFRFVGFWSWFHFISVQVQDDWDLICALMNLLLESRLDPSWKMGF